MRVVLHIGTEKTGTTTLQDFVYANREVLLRHGVGLSDLLGTTNNRKLASFCMPELNFDDYFKDRQIVTVEQKREHFAGFREAFLAEVRAMAPSVHTLLITSEHFHSRLRDVASIRRLKDLLDEVAEGVTVVCYFREQSAVVRSLYSTAVKSGNAADFATFARHCGPRNPYFNYFEFFSHWRDVFGAQSLRPRVFARDHFVGGELRRDFLSMLLPGADPQAFEYSPVASNRGLGLIGIELGRMTNRVFGRYNADGTLNPTRRELMHRIIHSEIADVGELAFPAAQSIYQLFHESNVRFAAEFLGRVENPFAQPAMADAAGPGDSATVPAQALLQFYGELLELMKEQQAGTVSAGPAPEAMPAAPTPAQEDTMRHELTFGAEPGPEGMRARLRGALAALQGRFRS
jgi:hypothetical protein